MPESDLAEFLLPGNETFDRLLVGLLLAVMLYQGYEQLYYKAEAHLDMSSDSTSTNLSRSLWAVVDVEGLAAAIV